MKTKIRYFYLSGLTFASVISFSVISPVTVAFASQNVSSGAKVASNEDTATDNYSKYDKYVKVVDNRYVLSIPNDVKIDEATITKINTQLVEVNATVDESGVKINPVTKVAIINSPVTGNTMLRYSAGRNGFEVHWNYVKIFISRTDLNKFKNIGSGALGAWIGARGGVAGAVIGAAVGGIIAEYGSFPGGMWFNYNYFYRSVTNYGWQ
ncbi:hypothetical protein [Leuconostoc kimchii]|uniref:Uncharacterized protein n=1 Tax=Leuconostoc kimchii TaxID=136609 RepID=A0ABX5SKP7_9LACO|nr:hypothetical protein [Leuconostoc kimchii]QBR46760.1 hypothetical protein EW139_00925 [Leuconostoc kimchii]